MADELSRLRNEFRALTERVEALEKGTTQAGSNPAVGTPELDSAGMSPAIPDGAFWALDGLQDRLPENDSTRNGAVMIVGSLALPSGAPVAWQQGVGAAGLLEADWGDRAAVFGALAHPVRIELLRHMLNGITATADLAAIDGLGTTGQLHHHLRQLVAAGWVRQGSRGSYEVPAARIVPLLASVLGAER